MNKMQSFIEDKFWFVLICGVVCALLFPQLGDGLLPYLRYLLMLVLFMVFIDIKPLEIVKNLKNWRLLLYLSVMSLLVVPAAFYLLSKPFGEDVSVAILLLAAMPAGLTTPALSGLLRGDTILAINLTICTSVLAPLTVPFVMSWVSQSSIAIDAFGLFRSILTILFLPMVVARIFNYLLPRATTQLRKATSTVNISLIFSIVYGALASQQPILVENLVGYLGIIILLYAVFILLHFIGFFQIPRAKKETRTASSISLAYMNNALAIFLAAEFFSPEVLIIVTLSEIPWATLLGPFSGTLAARKAQ